MKYFVFDSERKGSCYLEFFKGKWDGKTYWDKDSISLNDNILYDCSAFTDALVKIASFDAYDNTEISVEQWCEIGRLVPDTPDAELYNEANLWVEKVFDEYDCFTILGL